MKAIFASIFVVLLSASAYAQVSPERHVDKRSTQLDESQPPYYSQFIISAELTAIGGNVAPSTRWSKLYGAGYGLELDYAHLWRVDQTSYLGLYTGLSFTRFSGKDEELAPGFKETMDDLSVVGIEVGGMFRENLGGSWFFDGRMGIGAGFYSKADMETTGGGVTTTDEVISSSSGFLITVGLRLGTMLSKGAELALGLSYQKIDGADAGPGFGSSTLGDQSNAVISLSLNLNF